MIVVAAVDSGDGCKFVSWNPSGETVSPDEHRSRLNVVLQIDRRGGLVRSARYGGTSRRCRSTVVEIEEN